MKKSYILILLFLFAVATLVFDLVSIYRNKSYTMRETLNLPAMQDQIYADLVAGKQDINWQGLDGTLQFIDLQYDCSDFKLVGLVRILYEFGDRIPSDVKIKIEKSILNFRYWWDEPGGNSMCYWSENHQILFASAEYLIGLKYPETLFPKSGLTGKEHSLKARKRILDWMEMRWKYGFTEFFSNVYYTEDIGGMINLINYASDEEMVKKMEIVMDLLMADVASQNINTMFVSASGRAYEHSRKGGSHTTLGGITDYYWGSGEKMGPGMAQGLVTSAKYFLPPVIAEIGKDTGKVVIRQCSGLDLSELKTEGYFGTDTRSMMMQLGMEAFTNPEIIRNTLSFVRSNNMFTNGFISELKVMDISLLSWLHLEPAVARFIQPPSDGVAIQKGNTYTYKTRDYSVYSAQNYHPGTYGDQQHVAGMNISNAFSVFHTHPALEEDVKSQSPNYWVGYGRLPDVGQDHNVSLAIYQIPAKKGMMEQSLLNYTHAYFPTEQFDTVCIENNYALGKKGKTYCALIATNPLALRKNTTDNLIQNGKKTFWIMEAGSEEEDQSFGKFRDRILNNQCAFDTIKLELTYQSRGNKYLLKYNNDFQVNDKSISRDYDRFDSPYCKAARKATAITFELNGKSLYLDFDKMIRKF
ncbi:MAG: hypothetical protein WCP08_05035 [Prolixibacteraceae bacterium]